MLDSKVSTMLFLYVDHPVRLIKNDGEIINGNLVDITEDESAVIVSVQNEQRIILLDELRDLRYVGKLTDYKTFAQTGEIDDAYTFDMAECDDQEQQTRIKYQEFVCTVSCHLNMDTQIRAHDVVIEGFSHAQNEAILESGNFLYTFSDGTCHVGTLTREGDDYALLYNGSKACTFAWERVADITRLPAINDTVTIRTRDGQLHSGIVCAVQQDSCRVHIKKIAYTEIDQIYYHGTVTECAPRRPGRIDDIYYCKHPHYLQKEEDEKNFQYGAKVLYAVGINPRGMIAKEVTFPEEEKKDVVSETKLGVVLSTAPAKSIGFIGTEYVMPACGTPKMGNIIFNPNDVSFPMPMKTSIYVVKYILTGQINEYGQQTAIISDLQEAVPKKYIGIVRVNGDQIEKLPLYQAVLYSEEAHAIYQKKEVEILCHNGQFQNGIVQDHTMEGFLLEGDRQIPYSDIESVRIIEKVASYGLTMQGVGFTESGLRFHINDVDIDSQERIREGNARISYVLANSRMKDKKELWHYFDLVDVVAKDPENTPVTTEEISESPAASDTDIPLLDVIGQGISLKSRFGELHPNSTSRYFYGIINQGLGKSPRMWINCAFRNPYFCTQEERMTLPKGLELDRDKVHLVPEISPTEKSHLYIVRCVLDQKGEADSAFPIEVVCKISKQLIKTADITEGDFLLIRGSNVASNMMEENTTVYSSEVPQLLVGESVFYEYERILENGEAYYYGLTVDEVIQAAGKDGAELSAADVKLWRFGVLTSWDKDLKTGVLNNRVQFDFSVAEQRFYNIIHTSKRRMLVAYSCKDGKVDRVKMTPDDITRLLPWQDGIAEKNLSNKIENTVTIKSDKERVLHYLTVRSDGLVNNYASGNRLAREKVYIKTIRCPDQKNPDKLVSVAAVIHLQTEPATIQYNIAQKQYMAYRDRTHFVSLENVDNTELAPMENKEIDVHFSPASNVTRLMAYLNIDLSGSQGSAEENRQRKLAQLKTDFEHAVAAPDIYNEVKTCLDSRHTSLWNELCHGDENLLELVQEMSTLCEDLETRQYAGFSEFHATLERAVSKLADMKKIAFQQEKEPEQTLHTVLERLELRAESDLNQLYKKSFPKILCRPNATRLGKTEDTLYVLLSNEINKQNAVEVEISVETDLNDNVLQQEPIRIRSLDSGLELPVTFAMDLSDMESDSLTVQWTVRYKCAAGYQNGRRETVSLSSTGEFSLLIARDGVQTKDTSAENPYRDAAKGNALTDKKMFFGRVDESKAIWEYLLDRQNGHLIPGAKTIVYGQKRSGKSSLVNQILNAMNSGTIDPAVQEKLPIALTDQEPIIIHIKNMGDIAGNTKDWYMTFLYTKILSEINSKLNGNTALKSAMEAAEIRVPDYYSVTNEYMLATPFEEFIRKFREWDQDQHKLVLVMDEFTRLCVKAKNFTLKGQEEWRDIPDVIIEKFSELGFVLIIIGHATMISSLEELGVINKSVESGTLVKEISALRPDEAESLICDPMTAAVKVNPYDTTIGRRSIERLKDLSGCSPYVLMKLCDQMFDHYRNMPGEVIAPEDVDAMLTAWFGSDEFKSTLFDNMMVEDEDGMIEQRPSWKFLRHLVALSAKSPNRDCSLEDARHLPELGTDEEIETIISKLEKQKVISIVGGRIRIHIGLFGEYIKYKNGGDY